MGTPDSSALNAWTRCTTSDSSSELELTTSGTTWPRTIAPQLKRTSRTSVLRSSPDTTSGCWTPLSTTTSWTEPCTSARLGVCDAFRSGRYTCEECVLGLEWVENYIEDPIM